MIAQWIGNANTYGLDLATLLKKQYPHHDDDDTQYIDYEDIVELADTVIESGYVTYPDFLFSDQPQIRKRRPGRAISDLK